MFTGEVAADLFNVFEEMKIIHQNMEIKVCLLCKEYGERLIIHQNVFYQIFNLKVSNCQISPIKFLHYVVCKVAISAEWQDVLKKNPIM